MNIHEQTVCRNLNAPEQLWSVQLISVQLGKYLGKYYIHIIIQLYNYAQLCTTFLFKGNLSGLLHALVAVAESWLSN